MEGETLAPSLNHYGARDHYQFTRTRTPAPRLASLLFYWGSTSDSLSADKPRGIGLDAQTTPTTKKFKLPIHIFRALRQP